MKFNKILFILFLLVIFLCISSASANEIDDVNATSISNDSSIEIADDVNYQDENDSEESNILQVSSQDSLQSDDDIIVVNNWNELQYYCSLTDKDYTLKLKENTNFYPDNPTDSNYQIKINNNVKIIGSNGSYIGDSSFHKCYIPSDGTHYIVEGGQFVKYTPIVVPDANRKSLTLENITFKWIYLQYAPDATFMQLGGNGNYIFKNCHFDYINTVNGNGAVILLKKGKATLDNCSFVDSKVPKGFITISELQSMTIQDCYFANNFAYGHTTCIMNWGNVTLYNTKFYKNRSAAWAGGITTYGAGVTNIYNCNFTENVAGWNGGALYVYNIVNIYNTTFEGNNCTTNNGGGAIGACQFSGIPRLYVDGCLFKENNNNCWALDELSTDGTGRGGAISFMDVGTIDVRNSVFIANSASIATAICAIEAGSYGSPDIYIINNTFINHTRAGDVIYVRVKDTICNISDNYYLGNSIEFSNLTLTKLNEGKEYSTLQITVDLKNPSYYDSDILNKTLYDVYVNGQYVKTVNSTTFTLDFGDLDICNVYVIPTISNRKSNEVTLTSTREYIFVSKNGSDSNSGISRDSPVRTIQKALDLARNCQNIIILDGDYSENLEINYDVTLKGEGNATLTNKMSFSSNANFTLKNLKINNLNTDTFIKQNSNNLFISNCIITNNNALLVHNNGFTTIIDSILLNNSEVLQGNGNYVLDYNWWGNSAPDLNINKYAILNITCDVDALENNQKANVKAVFYLNDGSKYTKLPEINLDITAVNGVVNKNITNIDSNVLYTLTAFSDGVLTINYNDFTLNKTFEFLKSNPSISITADDIMFGDNLTITVNLPNDVEGNLTVNVGNISQTKCIESPKTVFTFTNLKAGTYEIFANYSGDKKYQSKTTTANVNVDKYQSTTNLNISNINVGEDVILTITTTNSSTGTITLSINNNTQTLTLNNSVTNYSIKNIKRGDYLITAVYNGDDKYLTSQDFKFIEVDNLNATMTIQAEDITYGETAIIKASLNDDATGEVFVTIDGITNSSKVINGKANISFFNLDAGSNKSISVFYSGDDTYFNKTGSANFTINKAELTFDISSESVKIGQDVVIHIKVPAKTSGTFTICDEVLIIPFSGSVDYTISDLEIGNYTYTATYNGNNYNIVSKSTSFNVSEYPAAQWPNQGFDTKNTGKSIYETQCNGEIYYVINMDKEIIGDLTVDSDGNIYVTTANGIYSYDGQGNLRYVFVSDTLDGSFSGTAIGRGVVISPKSGDTLYFINQTTGEKYGSSNIYQGSSIFAPILDSDANIYIMSEYQVTNSRYSFVKIPYKAWEFGGEIKSIDLGKFEPLCSPTLDENIIVIVSDNRLRMIDAKTLETISIKQGNYLPVRPVIGEGSVVYTVLSDSIVAYNVNGVQVWKTKVIGGVGNTLAIDTEQAVYHINAKGLLYKYDIIDGAQSKVSNLKVTSGLLIGSDGTLYFGSNNIFYAMDSEGNVLWKSDVGSKIIGNPVMDSSGLIYVPTENGVTALTYVPLKDSDLKIQVDDIVEGKTATVTVTWNSQATGTVTCNVNGEEITANADDGKITKTISGLNIGYYDVDASYSGDMRFKPTATTKTFVVRSSDDVANNIQFDGNRTFSFSLNNAKGNLTVKVNNKTYSKVLVNGKASITVDNLAPGEYEALATYSGDDIYSSANRTFTVSVPKFNITLNEQITTENVISTISVTLPSDATGNVTLSVGTKKYTEKITNGKATITVDDLPAGNYTATLTYSGDSKYESVSKSVSINPTRIPVTLDDTNVFVESGTEVKISITLSSDATGRFSVTVDNQEYSQDISNDIVISNLEPGNYTGTLTYSGDKKYDKASCIISFEVINTTGIDNYTNTTGDNGTAVDNSTNGTVKDNVIIIVSVSDVNVGEDAVIQVISSESSIKLTISVNDNEFNLTGSGNAIIPDLSAGNYTVVVSFAGDDKFNNASNSTSFKVLKVYVPLTNETITLPDSNSTAYSISLPSDATGTLTVTVDGKDYTETLVNGKATVNIPELSDGDHNITVIYSGDGKYDSIVKSSIVNVNRTVDNVTNTTVDKVDPTLIVSAGDVNVGDNAVISVKTSVQAGNVTVNVNGKDYDVVIKNGEASLTVPDLNVGNYTVIATFSGDDNFNEASNSTSFKVLKVSIPVTDETVTVPSSDSTTYGISLPGDATGTLTVTVDGKNYTETLVNGKATVNIPELTTGTHNITVTYSGDDKYSPITKSSVVTKDPVIRLTGSNLNMLYTSGKYFKVRLTADGEPLAGKTVKITINGNTYSRTTNKDGYVSLKISLPPKTYSVKASYANATITKKVVVKSVIKAKNVNAKKSAKTVKIKVTLKKVNNKYLKNKKVTLKFNKKTFKAKTNKKGVVTFTVKKNVYKKLKTNRKYTYQVIYGKDKVKKTIKFKN